MGTETRSLPLPVLYSSTYGGCNCLRAPSLNHMLQRVAHRGGGLPTFGGIFDEGSIDDLANGLRKMWRALAEGNRRLFEDGLDSLRHAAVADDL